VRKQVFVVAHPGFRITFLDEFNQPPGKLVEEGFCHWDINDGVLNAADVCTCHGDVLHCGHLSDSFNEGGDLLPILLANTPVDLVSFGLHFNGGVLDKFLVILWCIVKGVDGC
jgi:hypothetical protein